MLEISDMSGKESLFYFQDSLKDWAKTELDRRGVQTLDDAIAIAESLSDYSAQPKDKRPKGQGPQPQGMETKKASKRQERAKQARKIAAA